MTETAKPRAGGDSTTGYDRYMTGKGMKDLIALVVLASTGLCIRTATVKQSRQDYGPTEEAAGAGQGGQG
jgi:hypothetical protein